MVSNKILLQAEGVIHVGAHVGQERDDYAAHDLKVMWFEPQPDVFETLRANLVGYPKQVAFDYLITDKDGDVYIFHISNNDRGASSSIFEMGKDSVEVMPELQYVATMEVKSHKLDSLPTQGFDALVLDVQGSELLVLNGAVETLKHVRFVQAESYDAEFYVGGATTPGIREFLTAQGFEEVESRMVPWARGNVYELFFEKGRSSVPHQEAWKQPF